MIFEKGDPIYTNEWQMVKIGHQSLCRVFKYLKKAYRHPENSILYDHFETFPSPDIWDGGVSYTQSVGVENSQLDVCLNPPYYGEITLKKYYYRIDPVQVGILLTGFRENVKPNTINGRLYAKWEHTKTGDYIFFLADLYNYYIESGGYIQGQYSKWTVGLFPEYIDYMECIVFDPYDTWVIHNFQKGSCVYQYWSWRSPKWRYNLFTFNLKIEPRWTAKFTVDAIVMYKAEPYDL